MNKTKSMKNIVHSELNTYMLWFGLFSFFLSHSVFFLGNLVGGDV